MSVFFHGKLGVIDRKLGNTPNFQKILELYLNGYGLKFIRKLIAVILDYPNKEIRNYIFDIFYSMLDKFQNHAMEWF